MLWTNSNDLLIMASSSSLSMGMLFFRVTAHLAACQVAFRVIARMSAIRCSATSSRISGSAATVVAKRVRSSAWKPGLASWVSRVSDE